MKKVKARRESKNKRNSFSVLALLLLIPLLIFSLSFSLSIATEKTESDCRESSSQFSCLETYLRETVSSGGIDEAMTRLAEEYASKNYTIDCHWGAHVIGDEMYLQEKEGKKYQFPHSSYYCGYGVYHGYLEALLRDNTDPIGKKKLVLSVCDRAEKDLGPGGKDNCLHGIGSGYTDNPPPEEAWGDINRVTQPGLDACEELLGGSGREWEICTTGVFATPAKFISEDLYGFESDEDTDLFEYCKSLPKKYHAACYGEFAPKVQAVLGYDFEKLRRIIDELPNVEYQKLVTRVSVNSLLSIQRQEDLQGRLSECRTYFSSPKELFNSCIYGVAWGALYRGPKDYEYEKAFEFCSLSGLSAEESTYCYDVVFALFKATFPKEKIEIACASLTDQLRNNCLDPKEVALSESL